MPSLSAVPFDSADACRIVLLEDQRMVAEGVASLLRRHPGLVVAQTFPTVAAALAESETLRLALSASTAQTHRRNSMGKLGLRSSVARQTYAQQGGFTTEVGARKKD